MSNFLFPLSEFNRIHQVIHGTIEAEGNSGKACTLFACIGALILNRHCGIKASAVAGGFAMCVTPDQNMLFGVTAAEGSRSTRTASTCGCR